MKRDLDLIRKILLKLEEAPFEHGWVDLEVEGYSPEQVSYHVKLLADKGLIEAIDLSTHDTDWPDWRPKWLTAHGHDFLDSIRSDTVWAGVKKRLGTVGGNAALEVVKAVAVAYIKDMLGLPVTSAD